MTTPAHRTAPGASYFVTTKCWEGRNAFQVTEIAEILLNTLFHYRDSGAYLLHEFVIMPDHLHLVLTPGLQTSLEKAIQLNYIRMNPVKARLCERSEDWPYSSANANSSLDGVPGRYQNLPSGAKAHFTGPPTPGL